MKKGLVLLLSLLLGSAGAMGQEATGRQVKVQVVDRRGNPVSKVVVQAQSADIGGFTDESGVYQMDALPEGDSIRVMLPRVGEVLVPVAEGMDFVRLTVRSARVAEAINPQTDEEISLGYGTTSRRNNTLPAEVIDVDEVARQTGASTFAELLTGQLAGVEVATDAEGNTYVSIRGHGPALIVVDGVEFGSFQEVENRFNVSQMRTIVLNKTGAGYGSKGGNGVVLFTTKK